MTAAFCLRQSHALGKASFISSGLIAMSARSRVYIFDSAVMIVARTRPSISFAFFSAVGVTSTPLVVVVIR